MTLAERLKKARDDAGPLVVQARETGLAITTAREKNEATADLDAKFELQRLAATDAVNNVNQLESLEDLERFESRETARLARAEAEPVDPSAMRPRLDNEGNQIILPTEIERMSGGPSGYDNPVYNQFTRMESHERAMYARAGVEKFEDFTRFNRVKKHATELYLVHGPAAGLKVFEEAGFKPNETHALISTNDELGGFLTDDDFRATIIKDLAGRATMRPICRVIRTGSPAIVIPTVNAYTGHTAALTGKGKTYSTNFAGSWKREGYVTGGTAPPIQNQPRFGNVRIPVHCWAPDAIEITTELMSDSRANLMQLLAEVISEVMRLDEDWAFLKADGVDKPQGLLVAPDITEVDTGAAATLTYNGLIDMWTTLPAQYRNNMRWMMNSLTYGHVLKLKDSQDRPLFPVNSMPGMLWGRSIVFNEFIEDVAAGKNPIVIGDFRYYAIVDRMELRMKRLVERYAPNLGLLPTARVGGQVLRPIAFCKQKVST